MVFDGISVSSSSSAALYIKQADKVFVTLESGTDNSLLSVGDYSVVDENAIDAAVFSKEDLTFNGEGSLTVTSKTGHGFAAKDDLVFMGGNYTVSAAKHGISANNSVRIADGVFHIKAGTDGIHAENTDDTTLGFLYITGGIFDITATSDGFSAGAYMQLVGGNGTIAASGKGMKATADILLGNGSFQVDSLDDEIHSNSNVCITGGTLLCNSSDDGIHADNSLTVSGGSIQINKSYEGLEGLTVDICGGMISVTSSDDGINAAGGQDASGFQPGLGGCRTDSFSSNTNAYIRISGGRTEVNASGDGIDSNGSIAVLGGELYVSGPTANDNAALDYDGSAIISGGIAILCGSNGMAQNFRASSTQGSILVTFSSGSSGEVTVKEESGNVLASYTPQKSYASVVVGCPGLIKGETYTVSAGSTSQSITLSSLIYSSGVGGGMSGGRPSGGFPGHRP